MIILSQNSSLPTLISVYSSNHSTGTNLLLPLFQINCLFEQPCAFAVPAEWFHGIQTLNVLRVLQFLAITRTAGVIRIASRH
jgi:hypothetical protein